MSTNGGIRYLKRSEINTEKWNSCVGSVPNGLIYAYTWYLDALCDNWDALVLDDYTAVMPLPWRKKWGIRYVYQPFFIQRLGLFSAKEIPVIPDAFTTVLCRHFSFIHFEITQPFAFKAASQVKRTNLIIDLRVPYESIATKFSKEAHKNIRKAKDRGCRLVRDVPVIAVINMYRQAYGALLPKVEDSTYHRLEQLATQEHNNGRSFTFGIEDQEKNLVYSALIFRDKNRIYYLLGAPTEKGRNMRATYFFIDQLLQQFANQPMIFDFEGSEIASVEEFYRKFGPQEEFYYTIKINNLPAPLRWIKK